MAKPTVRQLRGLNDLITDAVAAGVTRTEQIHRAIARHPYALLKRISPISAPVRTVEFVETTISGSVYWTLRLATVVSGRIVSQALEGLDVRESETEYVDADRSATA
ncbi:MAG TPA: hypothetical protein PLW68_12910 [Casimicrobiaceae bacterium]|nr:hypothetical protein [Casimicrobiaceae bacterium]